jgi:ribosome-binding protein aMBF1 (putative translation factor)
MGLPARRQLPERTRTAPPATIDRLPVKAAGDRSHPGGILDVYAERIRTVRIKKGWTQLELGYRSGVTPTHISRIESGKCYPRLDTVERIAFALEVKVEWLIAGKGGNYVHASEVWG